MAKKFNGLMVKADWFSDIISNLIIFIDWIGNDLQLKDYKEKTFEKNKDYNIVIIYTSNKIKSFFINLLKPLILKYPKNGGK